MKNISRYITVIIFSLAVVYCCAYLTAYGFAQRKMKNDDNPCRNINSAQGMCETIEHGILWLPEVRSNQIFCCFYNN